MNDTLLLGACPDGPSPSKFLVSPNGYFMLHCAAPNVWRDIDGTHVYQDGNDPLLHLGYGDLALTKTRVIDLATGSGSPLVDLPAGFIYAIRAVPPDKFWIVLRVNADASQALFEVSRDGSVRRVGTFPDPPSGVTVATTGSLDKNGALYQLTTRRSDTTIDGIVMRRDIDGKFEVVHDDGANPLVHVGSDSMLFTGP